MKIFKSLPAVVALVLGVLSTIIATLNAFLPAILAKLPAEAYPLVAAAISFVLVVLHYEQIVKDGAGALAGTVPWQTVLDDIRNALIDNSRTMQAQGASLSTIQDSVTAQAAAADVRGAQLASVSNMVEHIKAVSSPAILPLQTYAAPLVPFNSDANTLTATVAQASVLAPAGLVAGAPLVGEV